MLNSSLPQNTYPFLMKSWLFPLKPSKFCCEEKGLFFLVPHFANFLIQIFWSSINDQFFGGFSIPNLPILPKLHDFAKPRKPIRLVRVQFGCLPPSLPMSSWGTWVVKTGPQVRKKILWIHGEHGSEQSVLSTSNPDISRLHIWLVVWNIIFSHFIYGMSSQPHWLSLHHFSRWLKPTTNQLYFDVFNSFVIRAYVMIRIPHWANQNFFGHRGKRGRSWSEDSPLELVLGQNHAYGD